MGRCHSLTSILVSLVLAFAAMSATGRSGSNPVAPFKPMSEGTTMDQMVVNASRALRKAGYNIMATALQISGEEILPPTPATLFAINDPALVNLSLPSWLMMDLLHYHTCPKKLIWETLMNKPLGACIPTLLRANNLVVTAVPGANRTLDLNGIPVSHPDIFTQGSLAIHGVHGAFFNFRGLDDDALLPGFDSLPVTSCSSSSHINASANGNPKTLTWPRVQAVLRAKGYLSFSMAIGLELAELIVGQQKMNLSRITVFAPTDQSFAYVSSASPLLVDMLRFHIVPKRLMFRDLLRLPVGSKIQTIFPGHHLQITSSYDDNHSLTINGVPVLHPDAYSSKEFTIHGIHRAFDMLNTGNSS
eukprot:Gb_23221 [translate_table: standard]